MIRNNKGIAFLEILLVLVLLFCLFGWFMRYKRIHCCPCGPVMIIEEQAPQTPEQGLYKEAP